MTGRRFCDDAGHGWVLTFTSTLGAQTRTCRYCGKRERTRAFRQERPKAKPLPVRASTVPARTESAVRLGYCPPAGSLALSLLGRDRAGRG